MRIQVVYSTTGGAMQQLARIIARALKASGTVHLASVSELDGTDIQRGDMLVVGCPSHVHGHNPAMRFWLDALPPDLVQGLPVATFDLTCRNTHLLDVPAAQSLAQRLQEAGAILIAPPESFFADRRQARLEPGEDERAIRWVHHLMQQWRHAHLPLPLATHS